MESESREAFFRIVGRNLRSWRKRARISQRKAAARLCASQSQISRWETGEAMLDLHSAVLLAALYDVSLERLLYEPPRKEA